MLTVIRSGYLTMHSFSNAALNPEKECGVSFVYSYKNKLEKNTVVTDAGLFKE